MAGNDAVKQTHDVKNLRLRHRGITDLKKGDKEQ